MSDILLIVGLDILLPVLLLGSDQARKVDTTLSD